MLWGERSGSRRWVDGRRLDARRDPLVLVGHQDESELDLERAEPIELLLGGMGGDLWSSWSTMAQSLPPLQHRTTFWVTGSPEPSAAGAPLETGERSSESRSAMQNLQRCP